MEPEEENFRILSENCNGRAISPIRAAVAEESKLMWLHDPGFGDWGFRVTNEKSQFELKAISINEILETYDLDSYQPFVPIRLTQTPTRCSVHPLAGI